MLRICRKYGELVGLYRRAINDRPYNIIDTLPAKFQFGELLDKLEFDEEYEPMKKLMTFVFSLIIALSLGGCNNKAASIDLIGGVDGPTAILVTSKINWPSIFGLIGVIIVILVAFIIYLNKQKK